MSEQETTAEATSQESSPESTNSNARPSQGGPPASGRNENRNENSADRRQGQRGGQNSGQYDNRQRRGRYGRDNREPVETPRYTSGAPAEYVRPTYRGRSRRVEGSIDIKDIVYKNVPLLTKFLDPYGRILSRRKTRVSAKIQRKAVKEIKKARHLCLLPYTGEHMRVARRKRRR
ncbi:MAG: 30S ribosomal protein S18 [Chloroflexota bacterium]